MQQIVALDVMVKVHDLVNTVERGEPTKTFDTI